jgi:hypothetical protein
MALTLILTALIVVAALTAFAARRSRGRALEGIRASWGKPVDRERRIAAMAASHRSRKSSIDGVDALDDRTWNDLNLDAVFGALDRTHSTLGQHALYHRLRTAPVAANPDAFEALVTRLQADAGARERAQMALSRLQDPQGYDLWWLHRHDAVQVERWYGAFPILTAATILSLLFVVVWSQAIAIFLVLLAINILVRYLTDLRIGPLVGAFRQLAPVIATAETLRFLGEADVQPIVGSLEPDTARLRRLKNISRWISGDPFMLPIGAGWAAAFANDVVAAVYEYLNLLFLLDANGLFFGAHAVREHRDSLLRVVAACGEIDAAISVASVRAGRSDWTRPLFRQPGSPAVLTGMRHPLLADGVPNSVTLAPGSGLLITGSNMSGKTTLLRTVGVTTVLAQTLNTCFATEYEAPVLRVRSSIGRSDDLLSGRSYYIDEVQTLLALVRASRATAPHLFLLDELFRGTNAVERIASGQAVLHELLRGPNGPTPHIAIAATHDAELVALSAGTYRPYHFGDAIGPDGLTFDHQLRPGAATTRNAIALLRMHGAPEEMIRRASACAATLDRERGITLQAR